MAKKRNIHVMTRAFRDGLIAVYEDALAQVGVEAEEIQPHLDSSATIRVTDAQLEAVRTIDDLVELSGHSNAGRITIHILAAADYLAANRPTLTDEEREARKSGGGTGLSAEEREAQRRAREELRQQLKGLHGIDLDADS